MNNFTVNYSKRTIEMTSAFSRAASKFDSDEYQSLVKAKCDFPDFKISIVAPKKKKINRFQNLTMAKIEEYVRSHDEDGENLKVLAELRGMKIEDGKFVPAENDLFTCVASFMEIKAWFLTTYEDSLAAGANRINQILANAKNSRKSA